MTKSLAVYLAGKITKHDWRQDLAKIDIGTTDWAMEAMSNTLIPTWETARNALGEGLHLTGPFFVGCDHGCGHSPGAHGITGGCIVTHASRAQTVRLCTQAIEESDVVFAWIDAPDAYGTLVELGYAKALGKQVIVAHPPLPSFRSEILPGDLSERDEMWFANSIADVEIAARTVTDAWEQAVSWMDDTALLLGV